MARAGKSDRVIVAGREGVVTDAAEFDNLVRVEYPDGTAEFMPQAQIDENLSERDFDTKINNLLVDYTILV